MTEKTSIDINFSTPGIYHIRVLGEVGQELWENFEGVTEQVKLDKKGQTITSLKLQVRDQAELSGLINLLYDWQLVLLSVKIEGLAEEIET